MKGHLCLSKAVEARCIQMGCQRWFLLKEPGSRDYHLFRAEAFLAWSPSSMFEDRSGIFISHDLNLPASSTV